MLSSFKAFNFRDCQRRVLLQWFFSVRTHIQLNDSNKKNSFNIVFYLSLLLFCIKELRKKAFPIKIKTYFKDH